MGFNNDDALNLKRARDSYFVPVAISVKDEQWSVMRLEIGTVITIEEPALRLADAMQSAMRFYNHGESTTVWLDIKTSHIPAFVTEAIERCVGFGLGLVVTHGECCSHPPGSPLPHPLVAAMDRAQRVGWVWHPIAEIRVSAYLN